MVAGHTAGKLNSALDPGLRTPNLMLFFITYDLFIGLTLDFSWPVNKGGGNQEENQRICSCKGIG